MNQQTKYNEQNTKSLDVLDAMGHYLIVKFSKMGYSEYIIDPLTPNFICISLVSNNRIERRILLKYSISPIEYELINQVEIDKLLELDNSVKYVAYFQFYQDLSKEPQVRVDQVS